MAVLASVSSVMHTKEAFTVFPIFITFMGFLPWEFCEVQWQQPSNRRISHTHYINRALPLCERMLDTSWGYISGERSSHVHLICRVSHLFDFCNFQWGHPYVRFSHTHIQSFSPVWILWWVSDDLQKVYSHSVHVLYLVWLLW
jgi:hypothetical protein